MIFATQKFLQYLKIPFTVVTTVCLSAQCMLHFWLFLIMTYKNQWSIWEYQVLHSRNLLPAETWLSCTRVLMKDDDHIINKSKSKTWKISTIYTINFCLFQVAKLGAIAQNSYATTSVNSYAPIQLTIGIWCVLSVDQCWWWFLRPSLDDQQTRGGDPITYMFDI